MTTTERSMKLMEEGINKKEREEEDPGCPVIQALARRAAEIFQDLDRECGDEVWTEDILEDIRELADDGDDEGAVLLLQQTFRNEGYDAAADEMELLEACDEGEVKKEFMDLFLEEDDVDDIEIRIFFWGGIPETVQVRKNPALLS